MRITTEPAELADDWQAAVLELRQQTARAGMPWSCTGGALLVQVDLEGEDRAVVRFRDDEGHAVQRHVPSARSLVPTAEAVLASAAPRDKAPPPVIDKVELALEQPPPDPEVESPRAARLRRAPRYIIDATMGARFSGPAPVVWFAPELRVTVPFEVWSGGVWVRYGLPHVFDEIPKGFSMTQVNLGLSAGRQLLAVPVDLHVTFNPSLSVISMEGDLPDYDASGAKIDLYLGAALRAAIPFTEHWRGVVGVDAEVVPASLRAERRIDPGLPALPAYELGLSLGVELVVR